MFPLGWRRVISFDLLGRGQCVCLRQFHPQRSRRFCLVKHYYEASIPTSGFERRVGVFRIEKHEFLLSRWCSLKSSLLKPAAEIPRFRSSWIWESTRHFRGHTNTIMTWWGYEKPVRYRYLPISGINWIIIDFPCPVGTMPNTSVSLKTLLEDRGQFASKALSKTKPI